MEGEHNKMKTLKEKRKELNIIIDNINNLEFREMNNFKERLKLINTIKFLIEKQDKEFIKEILGEIDHLIKGSMECRKDASFSERFTKWNWFIDHLNNIKKIIKQKSGFEE